MKRNTDANFEITLLEKRLINEEYAKATLEKQSKLIKIRECNARITDVGKNGGII